MVKTVLIIIAILIVLSVSIWVWKNRSSFSPQPTLQPPVNVIIESPSPSDFPILKNEIQTNDQTDGDVLTIDSVAVTKPGFVVIHKLDQNGKIGALVGHSDLLNPGAHESVDIDIASVAKVGDRYIAIIHEDTNNNNKFDGDTIDLDLTENGQMVSTTFKVTASDSDIMNTTPQE